MADEKPPPSKELEKREEDPPRALVVPPIRPKFEHTLKDLKHTTLMVGSPLEATYGVEGRHHVEKDPNGWLVRVHGPGIGHTVADALKLAEILDHLAKSVRWIGNALYPTQGAVPGISLARAGNSVVLHFTAGLKEEPIRIGEEREYVSIAGGEYMATLMGAAADEERVASLLGALDSRRAVGVYAGTLDGLVRQELGLNVLMPLSQEPGPRPREAVQIDITVEEAVEDLRFLRSEPRMVTSTETRVGPLFALNDKSGRFSMTDEDTKEDITGVMSDDVRDQLGPVWRKRVKATIRLVEPEYDWLPRARGTSRTLIAAEPAPTRRRRG